MHPADAAVVPHHRQDVREELIDDELLLYVPTMTQAIYLNGPAAIIWGLCDGHRDLNEVTSIIAETYPDAGPSLSEQVVETVRQLVAANVLAIERADCGSAAS